MPALSANLSADTVARSWLLIIFGQLGLSIAIQALTASDTVLQALPASDGGHLSVDVVFDAVVGLGLFPGVIWALATST